jgi:hypothetical protein
VSSQEILVPALSKWLKISFGLEKAFGKEFEVLDSDWPAPGCHGGDAALD